MYSTVAVTGEIPVASLKTALRTTGTATAEAAAFHSRFHNTYKKNGKVSEYFQNDSPNSRPATKGIFERLASSAPNKIASTMRVICPFLISTRVAAQQQTNANKATVARTGQSFVQSLVAR